MYILKLEEGVWFNGYDSDPGRTLVRNYATQFKTKRAVKKALTFARKFRPFKDAKIEKI